MQMISPAKKEFIEFMMSADVLRFGEFTTKSGRLSPYFVNTGNYRTGAQIATLGKFYAQCIMDNCGDNFDAMFGPAYKGIPLVTTAAGSLARDFNIDKPYFFNRKEAKDHGEGGNMVGAKVKDGDRIAIVEDVVTAGTAVRESIALFKNIADVKIGALFVSVDRMEKGTGEKSALDELREDYGIQVFPIVTVRQIIDYLYNRPVDGKVYIDDAMKARMEAYLDTYGAKS